MCVKQTLPDWDQGAHTAERSFLSLFLSLLYSNLPLFVLFLSPNVSSLLNFYALLSFLPSFIPFFQLATPSLHPSSAGGLSAHPSTSAPAPKCPREASRNFWRRRLNTATCCSSIRARKPAPSGTSVVSVCVERERERGREGRERTKGKGKKGERKGD